MGEWPSLVDNGEFFQISAFQELFKLHSEGEKKHGIVKTELKRNFPANLWMNLLKAWGVLLPASETTQSKGWIFFACLV